MERDNQENRREPFRSSMHWYLQEIAYHRRKVLGGVTLFGERAGMVGCLKITDLCIMYKGCILFIAIYIMQLYIKWTKKIRKEMR